MPLFTLPEERILNALPSPPDPRDWVAPLDTALVLPRRKLVSLMGPVNDQGTTGTCVAWDIVTAAQQLGRRDGWGVLPLDGFRFYDLVHTFLGTPDPERDDGLVLRDALRVARGSGIPTTDGRRAGKIGAYYRVPATFTSIQTALVQWDQPLPSRIDFDAQWQYLPASRVLKAPIGRLIGGHGWAIWGYDLDVRPDLGGSLVWRNSWGIDRGKGTEYMPWAYVAGLGLEVWRVEDLKGVR